MFERKIPSFTLDHDAMEPGLYRRKCNAGVATWDMRFKKPNEERLTGESAHSIEHILATAFRGTDSDNIVGIAVMGCLTGIYFLVAEGSGFDDEINIKKALVEIAEAAAELKKIPGASSSKECGSYLFHDLAQAKVELRRYAALLK